MDPKFSDLFADPSAPQKVSREPAVDPSFDPAQLDQALEGINSEPVGDELDSVLDQINTEGDTTQEVLNLLNERGFFKSLGDRLGVSAAMNDKQAETLLRNRGFKKISKDKDGNWIADGKRLDPGSLEGDPSLADKGKELTLDLADHAGPLVQGIVSALVEGGLIKGMKGPQQSLPAGMSFETAPKPGIGQSAKAVGLGSAPATFAGQLARNAIYMGAGGPPQALPEYGEAWGEDYALNLVGAGTGHVASRTLSNAGRLVRNFVDSLPKNRIEQVAAYTKMIKDIPHELGVVSSMEKMGSGVNDVIDHLHNKLGSTIGIYKDEVVKAVGDTRYVPPRYKANLKELIESSGGLIDSRSGVATIGPDTVQPFGLVNGKQVLGDLIDKWNEMNNFERARGGFMARDFFDKAEASFDVNFKLHNGDDKLRKKMLAKVYGPLHQSIAQDRNEFIASNITKNSMFTDETTKAQIGEAFKEYNRKVDTIKELRAAWSDKQSALLFSESLVRKGEEAKLRNLKNMLGESSDTWKNLRATYLSNQIERNISESKGLFSADKFIKEIKGLGQEVRDIVIPDEQYGKLVSLARSYERINKEGLTKQTNVSSFLDFVGKLIPGNNAIIKGKTAWSMAKSNASLADYMRDEGFLKLAKESWDKREKSAWMKAAKVFETYMLNSVRVETKDGRVRYVTRPFVRNILTATLPEGTLSGPARKAMGMEIPDNSFKGESLTPNEMDFGVFGDEFSGGPEVPFQE